MENTGLTASDVALLNNGDHDDWGNNGFMWIFALLILAMGGFGGIRQPSSTDTATSADVQNGFNFAALERQNNETIAAIRQGVYDTTSAVKDASYNNLAELRNLQAVSSSGFAEMQKNCCDIEKGIDGINYNNAINTANINANTTAQVQRVLDAINDGEKSALQRQVDNLQLQLSMAGVVRYPQAITYNAGYGPYCNCGNVG